MVEIVKILAEEEVAARERAAALARAARISAAEAVLERAYRHAPAVTQLLPGQAQKKLPG
jgi:hypothetical protein